MFKGRTSLTLVSALLVAGGLSAQSEERITSRMEGIRSRLGLIGEHALKVTHQNLDAGVTVNHLQQYFRGIKVWGGLVNVRDDSEEMNISARKVFDRIDVNILPSLSYTEVRNLVDRKLRGMVIRNIASKGQLQTRMDIDRELPDEAGDVDGVCSVQHLSQPTMELAILPIEEMRVKPKAAHKSADQLNAEDVTYVVTGYRLVYHVETDAEVKGFRELMNYLVDAHTGEIVEEWNMVKRVEAAGTAKTKYLGDVTLYTNQNGSTYECKDPLYFNNYVSSSTSSSTPYKDTDNVWGNNGNWADGTTEAKQTGAAEALHVLQRECQMLKAVWGRDGSSGTGKAIKVVWGQYDASSTACAITKDYIVSGYANSRYNDMNTLDILGHEYGHSFDYYTAKLCTNKTGEGGGMGEAHGDIMGLLTEVYAKYTPNDPYNPATTIPEAGINDPKTWIMGEDAVKSVINEGKGTRFFIKPSLATASGVIDAWKSTMSRVGVHAAAGPTDRMFYYLAVGAPSSSSHDGYTSYLPDGSSGIGLHKAANIWVRTIMSGRLSASSKHIDARNACIETAKSLYGAGNAEEQAVWNAYAGVNVGSPWPSITISPSSATILSGATQNFTSSIPAAWTCTGGSFNTTSGTNVAWTAPVVSSSTSYTITATSQADSSKKATATVTVNLTSAITYNEVESNGSISTANAVPDNATTIVAYIGSMTDNDYFKVLVNAGCTLTVNMTGPAKNYDLYLYTSSNTLLKSSTGTTSTESVSYTNSGTTAAYYYIRVKGYNYASSTSAPYNLALIR